MQSYFDTNTIVTSTTGGKAWAEKYLHPPGITPPDYAGYPDDTVNSTIRAEYRLVNTVLSTTGGLPSTGALYLITPGVLNPIFVAKRASDTQEPAYTSIVPNGEISPEAAVANYQSSRNCYQSTTMRLNCTAFNNSGFFSIGQTAVTTYTLDVKDAFFTKYQEYRAGHTPLDKLLQFVKHLVPLEHRQKYGEETLGKILGSLEQMDLDLASFKKAIKAIPTTTNIIQVARLGQPPRTPGDVTDLSPKFAEIEAKEGCFVVSQKTQPTNDFKPVTSGYISNGQGVPSLTRCAYEFFNKANVAYLEWFLDDDNAPVQDLAWSNWSWTHVMLTGLTPNSSQTNQPPVHFKHIIGTESIALPRSILNTQVKRPALFDPEALASAAKIVQSRADGLLAIFNELGNATEVLTKEAAENPMLDTVLNTGSQPSTSLSKRWTAPGSQKFAAPIAIKRTVSNEMRKLERQFSKTRIRGRQRTPSKVRSNSRRRSTSRRRSKSRNKKEKRVVQIYPRRRRRSKRRSKSRARSR